MATFYAEAELSDGDPVVRCFTLSIRQAAGLGNLLSAAGAAGATAADIRPHSRFLGTNPNDFVYVPAVRDELARRGFDGFIGLDFIYVERHLIARDDTVPGPRLQRVAKAVAVLAELGLGGRHTNERTDLVLLSLLALPRGAPWSGAGAPTLHIHDMLAFMRTEYDRAYAENTRETIWDESVKPLLEAGVVVANPDRPGRTATSPKFCYRVAPSALTLLHTHGTPVWKVALQSWHETVMLDIG